MSNLQPTSVALDADAATLRLGWNDGRQTSHPMAELRRLCPCATCRTERDKMQARGSMPSLRVISGPSVEQGPGAARIVEVTPVGRYALTFRWNDGHATGIYSYDFLLQHQQPEA